MSKSKNEKSNIIYEDGFFMGKNEMKIFYRSFEIESSKSVIVISHGIWESIEKYREFIKTLNKNNYSVYIMEHRGHARSGRLGIDSSQINVEDFNYYVEDLKTFLDSIVVPNLNNRKLYLYAHSMGGAIGALFLEKYNNYFEKAILNAPMMDINTGKYPKIFSKVISKLFCMIGLGNKYLFGQGPFNANPDLKESGTSSDKRYNSYFYKQLEHKELQTAGASFNWLNQSFKGIKEIFKEENIKNINAEILLFQAGKDLFVKPEGQNKFTSLVKSCKLIKIEDSKHDIYREKDEIFKKYIEKVLEFYEIY
ncbi:alpha/beta fold hydrolase [Romboutsia sp. 13368]|uniref:alpha/beta fold hydrolase n=1 Tax=Romboutsia sp. 13368 TaxID=2708053 RepID=UPI0025EE4C21|nr:alpha/beta hydrolase [Romboutsia sp. 13368]